MLVRWLLFETKVGEVLLVFLEQKVGLAVIAADRLAMQRSGRPTVTKEVTQ
jgi:hypothetical protein